MALELGDVIGVLLDPPSMGHAVLRQEEQGETTEFDAFFIAGSEREGRPVQWRYRSSSGGAALAQNGVVRHFQDGEPGDVGTGRPDYVAPCLHLLFPLKAYFWGRPGDDWKMRSDVRSDGPLAVVRLTNLEDPNWDAHLTVDMERRLAVAYSRPSSVLALVSFDGGPPGVAFDRL